MTDWRILNKGFHVEYLVLVESEFVKYFNALIHLAFRCFLLWHPQLSSFPFVLVLSAHARVCIVCLCAKFLRVWMWVWYLTQIIIDKSLKYGCHFSLAPIVIWGSLYSSTYIFVYCRVQIKLLLLLFSWSASSCDSLSKYTSTETWFSSESLNFRCFRM